MKDVLEGDFFFSAKRRDKRPRGGPSSDAESARSREDYGWVRRDLDRDFGQRYLEGRTEEFDARI